MNSAAKGFRIRRMVAADVSRAMAVAESLSRAPRWPRAVYETALNPQTTPERIALLAEDAATGTLKGFAMARLTPPEAELETVVVAAEFQRRGVARQLCSALAVELREQGIREIVLEVRVSNGPAQSLYRSLGFRETDGRARYYADPVEDAVVMLLEVDGVAGGT